MNCGFCGKPFTAILPTAEYCSAKCRVYASRARKRRCVTPSVTPSAPTSAAGAEPCVTPSVTFAGYEMRGSDDDDTKVMACIFQLEAIDLENLVPALIKGDYLDIGQAYCLISRLEKILDEIPDEDIPAEQTED